MEERVRVEITSLNPSDFDGTQLKRSGTVVALFTADWCPFCRAFAPVFESAREETDITKAVVDLSNQENPLWEVFEVHVVPTVIVFRDGVSVIRKDGVLGRGLPHDVMAKIMIEIKATRTIRT
jgi:thiol-disulfide isomerase/thioredoxin